MSRQQSKIYVLVLVAFLFVSSGVVKAAESNVGLEVGNTAPDFTLSNLQGAEMSLSDFRGQYVVLNFWATWCPPCRQEMPHLNKFHRENENFSVVAVNLRENKERVKRFIRDNNYQFTVLLDQTAEIGMKYQTTAIPTTYFLDRQGRIKHIRRGILTEEELKKIKQKITEES